MLMAGQKKGIRKGVIFDYDRVEICSCWGKISRQQEVLLTEERPYPHLLLHRSAGPALPQPVDNLLRNVETLVQRHSCLRSEDTLQRLLEKVNRVPLHEDFHFRVTNGQRAEVKRACTAKEYPAFCVRFAIKKSFALQAYHSNNYKFTSNKIFSRTSSTEDVTASA